METLELLAPAKNYETAVSAILCGADAIFIGGPAFGARVDASNQLEEIKKLVKFAHLFKVKVHVTLNTLLYDKELVDAQELINAYAKMGVDALIIQDLGLFSLKIPKSLELHASTQCCIDTVEKLKFYEKLGVTQVVLPREFTLEQIKAFKNACPKIRLEAFVMGALCVGVSGICMISEELCHRSANRGCCAQICRLPMQLCHKGREVKRGYLLSLKDNNQEHNLSKLIDAGVSSFKIEGRLKDESYVANATATFSQKLDSIIKTNQNLSRQSFGKTELNFKADLSKIFNRTFTDGLLTDNKDKLVNDRTPKFIGPMVGKVIKTSFNGKNTEVTLKKASKLNFANGDGLTYFSPPQDLHAQKIENTIESVQGFRCNNVLSDLENTATLQVYGKVRLAQGTVLYRNVDIKFEESLKQKNFALRTIFYKLKLEVTNLKDDDYRCTLSLIDEYQHKFESSLDFTFDASQSPLIEDKIASTLSKKGSIYTRLEKLTFKGELEKLTLKISQVNALRKELLTKWLESFETPLNKLDEYYQFDLTKVNYPCKTIDKRLVLNAQALKIYEMSACKVEDQTEHNCVLTSKYCLVRQYGKCSKEGGKVSDYSLVIGGKTFNVVCDCKNCRMKLFKSKK